MATPNYGYEKRQRELAKKKKKEEKAFAKSQRKTDEPGGESEADGSTGDAAGTDAPAADGAADSNRAG
ncbi:hypothetical protein [Paracidovorax konjaci]|uniref:Uncharacterized protein n=1 Tax=Paracidovorax konjaci TaxID=32040 RepID=A0A1I1UAK1_9BURK|nr:hypothetical protein [Paracidovorax konjaci]SFD66598.1 hypothetical protein SAMN04489710_104376 [Paracidovorax konjaci]